MQKAGRRQKQGKSGEKEIPYMNNEVLIAYLYVILLNNMKTANTETRMTSTEWKYNYKEEEHLRLCSVTGS